MSDSHQIPGRRHAWPWWRWGLTIMCLLALTLSAYLSWLHLVGGSAIGCGGGSGCDQVLNSRWSSIAGILPISGLAMGAYLALLVAILFIGPTTETSVRNLAWRAMLLIVGAAAGSAVWFTIVQKWMVGAFCLYCIATHTTGVLLAVLVIWRAYCSTSNPDPPAGDDVRSLFPSSLNREPSTCVRGESPWRVIIPSFAFGLALAGLLAVCQVVFAPPPVYRGGESPHKLSPVESHAAPLVGSSNAPYVVSLLFDYECPHCQQMQFMLDEAIRQFNGKLAFALCPVPLNTNCNPYVQRNLDQFKDSCELTKVGLAVWCAKREAFPEFNRWMFTFESGDRWHPRSLDAAKSKAIELVGQTKFDAAFTNRWINQHIERSTRIFGDTGSNAVPKLVFGSRWVIPQPHDADGLVWILCESLGVPKP